MLSVVLASRFALLENLVHLVNMALQADCLLVGTNLVRVEDDRARQLRLVEGAVAEKVLRLLHKTRTVIRKNIRFRRDHDLNVLRKLLQLSEEILAKTLSLGQPCSVETPDGGGEAPRKLRPELVFICLALAEDENIEATPAPGAYFVEGSYDFAVQTQGSAVQYGYKVQDWDGEKWTNTRLGEGTDYTHVVTDPSVKTRLVWRKIKPFILIVR